LVSDSSKENLETDTPTSASMESASIVSTPSMDGKSDDSESMQTLQRTNTATDWPLNEIKEPHKNDVLYGRGGGTNHHPGNKRYRSMVERRKGDYVNSKRLDKPLVALEIIKEWRSQDPPGRFLKMEENTGMWSDVGDKKAREKTSQALREKAPLLRKQHDDGDYEGEGGSPLKNTRFDANAKKRVDLPLTLQRDHSLGRDYLETTEKVAVEGFSWTSGLAREERPRPPNSWCVQEGVPMNHYNDMSSPARIQRHSHHSHPHGVDPLYPTSIPLAGSNGWSVPESNPVSPVRSSAPVGEYDWPPQPLEATPGSDDSSPARWEATEYRKNVDRLQIPRDRELPPHSDARRHPHEGNGEEDIERHHFSQVVDILDDPDPSWRNIEPSTVHYPRGESIPVEYDEWASPSRRSLRTSGPGGGNNTPRHSNKHNPRNMDLMEPLTVSAVSDDDPYAPQVLSDSRAPRKSHFGDEFESPQFRSNLVVVSPSEGSTPSSTPRNRVHSDSPSRRGYQPNVRHHTSTPSRKGKSNIRKSPSLKNETPYYQPTSPSDRMGKLSLTKPPPVKRDTSNQNESAETKPSVKKMNRQRSIGSRIPPHLDKVSEKEVTSLGNCLEQSSLENGARIHAHPEEPTEYLADKLQRPEKIKAADRVRTYDSFDMAIEKNVVSLAIENNVLSLGKTGDIDVHPDYEGDEKDSANWRPTSFSFPDHESAEENCQTSPHLSYPPAFLNISDRLSSLGSVEGFDANVIS